MLPWAGGRVIVAGSTTAKSTAFNTSQRQKNAQNTNGHYGFSNWHQRVESKTKTPIKNRNSIYFLYIWAAFARGPDKQGTRSHSLPVITITTISGDTPPAPTPPAREDREGCSINGLRGVVARELGGLGRDKGGGWWGWRGCKVGGRERRG